jgi:hypothetical protein
MDGGDGGVPSLKNPRPTGAGPWVAEPGNNIATNRLALGERPSVPEGLACDLLPNPSKATTVPEIARLYELDGVEDASLLKSRAWRGESFPSFVKSPRRRVRRTLPGRRFLQARAAAGAPFYNGTALRALEVALVFLLMFQERDEESAPE